MPSFDGWLRDTSPISDLSERDFGSAWMVDRAGVSITLERVGTAQTVILVPSGRSNTGTEQRGETGQSSDYDVALIGMRDHATIADFNVRRGDTFEYKSTFYEVINVDKTMPGKTEARCKARQ